MSSNRGRVPGVPDIPGGIPAPVRTALVSFRETLAVLTGQLGDPLDQVVRRRDLTDGTLSSLGGGGSVLVIGGGGSGGGGGSTEVIESPTTPTNVEAWGAISFIFVSWDRPSYKGHSHTEVWAAGELAGSPGVGDFSSRVLIGTSMSAMFADAVAPQTVRYYWVRHVNKAATPEYGPWSNVSGARGESSLSPSYILPILQHQITESQLYADLGARINLIDGPSTLTGSVAARILAEATARGAAITTETNARQAADTSLANSITTLTASVNNNAAAITSEATARANADSALSSRIDSVAAAAGAHIFRQATAPAGAVAGDLWYDTANNNVAKVKNSSGGWDPCDDTRIAATQASVTSEATARANADTSLANSITSVSSTVNGHTTTIAAQATSINGLNAQYTVKIDSNGYITGFGLASTTTTAGPTSSFLVRADSFAIASPAGPGITPRTPFIVYTTPQTINGVSVPAGIYMTDGFLMNGTINNLKFDRASGNRIQLVDADIVDVSADKILTGTLGVGRYIQSQGYVPNAAGFRINASGYIDAADIDVRGRVRTPGKWWGDGAQGVIMNCYASDPFIELWRDSNNYLRWHPSLGLIVRGDITASSLTVVGTSQFSVKSSASGGRNELTSQNLKTFDDAGTLRVRIGNLSV